MLKNEAQRLTAAQNTASFDGLQVADRDVSSVTPLIQSREDFAQGHSVFDLLEHASLEVPNAKDSKLPPRAVEAQGPQDADQTDVVPREPLAQESEDQLFGTHESELWEDEQPESPLDILEDEIALADEDSQSFNFVIALVILGAIALSSCLLIYFNKLLLNSSDVRGYLYLGKEVLCGLLQGLFSPVLNSGINNSTLALSFGIPLSSLVMGLVSFVTSSYLVQFAICAALSYFFTSAIWAYIGTRVHKTLTGFLLGALITFVPTSLALFFVLGDIPACFALALFPLFLLEIRTYLYEAQWKTLIKLMVLCLLSSALDVRASLFILVASVVYSFAFGFYIRSWKHSILVTVAMLLTVFVLSIWLVPAYLTGLNLNVFYDTGEALCIIGVLLVCTVFFCLVQSDISGKLAGLVCSIVIVVACLYPTYRLWNGLSYSVYDPKQSMYDSAFAQTSQRLGCVDGSQLSVSTFTPETKELAKSLVLNRLRGNEKTKSLQKSFVERNFTYFFDRISELGCDTVLVNVESLTSEEDFYNLDASAENCGFELGDSNDVYRLYVLTNSLDSFGLISEYKGIAIGENAGVAARLFPALVEGEYSSLDKYSYSELKQYEVIYLDGFTYTDQDSAQQLLEKLAVSGCRIVINGEGQNSSFEFATSYAESIISDSYVIANGQHELIADPETDKLSRALDIEQTDVSIRTQMSLTMEASAHCLRFTSANNNVNTTYLDNGLYAEASGTSTRDGFIYVNSGTTELVTAYPYLMDALKTSVLGLCLTAVFFVALIGWERHLVKVNEITDMAREALEVARTSTTSAAVDVEPSSWSAVDWTNEQIQEYVQSRPVFKRFTSYPSLDDLAQLAQSMGPEAWHASSDVAQVLAQYLKCHPQVMAVRYPGLKTDPLFDRAATTLNNGFGPYVWFATSSGSEFIDCTNECDAKELVMKVEHFIAYN